MRFVYPALILLPFVLLWKHIFGPFLVRAKVSRPVNPTFDEIPDEHARELFPPSFFDSIRELEALGFALVCHLSSGGVEQTHTVLSLMVNRESRTQASIGSIVSLRPGAPSSQVNYVEFTSRFSDGHEIDTANVSSVSVFYPDPERTAHKIPHLKDLADLYHVHEYVVRQHGSRTVLPDEGLEVRSFIQNVKHSQDKQVELGFFFLDEKTQRYRHTWRSACRATWRSLWPLKSILLRQQEREGRRLASEAGRTS